MVADVMDDRPWQGRIRKRSFYLGMGLVLLSFFMPFFFHVDNFGVLSSLSTALESREKTDLMLAALQLVMLNSLRGIPHYLGAFFIGTSFEIRNREKPVWLFNAALMLTILYTAYGGIEAIHNIHYDFGIPAAGVSGFLLLFSRLDPPYVAPVKKALQVVLFLAAFQFLDIMPMVSGLPIGRGETSWDVKMAAAVLGAEELLNVMGAAGCLILFLFALLIFFLLREENNLRQLAVLQQQNEEIRTAARLKEMENRTYQEIQHLVHDLKSPLTAMQTLVGILKMQATAQKRTQEEEYLTRIENSIVHLSRMISEILYEDRRSDLSTQGVVDLVLAQISVTPYAKYVHTENRVPEDIVSVNRFLFPRAMINLIQNSASAIPENRVPDIHLRVDRVERDGSEYVSFCVRDNGSGIAPDQQEKIWGRNVSGTSSSGLGLAFVRSVVDKLGGEITLESVPQKGTSMQILLPREAEA